MGCGAHYSTSVIHWIAPSRTFQTTARCDHDGFITDGGFSARADTGASAALHQPLRFAVSSIEEPVLLTRRCLDVTKPDSARQHALHRECLQGWEIVWHCMMVSSSDRHWAHGTPEGLTSVQERSGLPHKPVCAEDTPGCAGLLLRFPRRPQLNFMRQGWFGTAEFAGLRS